MRSNLKTNETLLAEFGSHVNPSLKIIIHCNGRDTTQADHELGSNWCPHCSIIIVNVATEKITTYRVDRPERHVNDHSSCCVVRYKAISSLTCQGRSSNKVPSSVPVPHKLPHYTFTQAVVHCRGQEGLSIILFTLMWCNSLDADLQWPHSTTSRTKQLLKLHNYLRSTALSYFPTTPVVFSPWT